MTDEDTRYLKLEFFGRCTSDDSSATLRFYPFSFEADPSAQPVLEVRFEQPKFDLTTLEERTFAEIHDVAPFREKIEFSLYDGGLMVLEARSVTTRWVAYDFEDHARHIKQLQDWIQTLNRDLEAARGKHEAGLSLVHELLRRAQLKADSSNHLHELQKSALAVLERLRRHFEQR